MPTPIVDAIDLPETVRDILAEYLQNIVLHELFDWNISVRKINDLNCKHYFFYNASWEKFNISSSAKVETEAAVSALEKLLLLKINLDIYSEESKDIFSIDKILRICDNMGFEKPKIIFPGQKKWRNILITTCTITVGPWCETFSAMTRNTAKQLAFRYLALNFQRYGYKLGKKITDPIVLHDLHLRDKALASIRKNKIKRLQIKNRLL